jgi:alcohol dehydrogenase class IV
MDTARTFSCSRTPRIVFGPGRIAELPTLAAAFGRTALLITGGGSLAASGRKAALDASLAAAGLTVQEATVSGEPEPEFVDQVVHAYRDAGVEVVIAVGGGSVLDAGKAVSAMLPLGEPVREYLEQVGTRSHPGTKVPFIAAPTTAGTGTEATKNAVLSRVGPDGYKCSLRHEAFVPEVALVDPELTLSCPRPVTAACGLDALAQLLEAYVSPQASPLSDAAAWSGLMAIKDRLAPACGEGAGSLDVRGGMAYAALASGLALANAGLGVVHSLAAVLGGRFRIPHGVLCGTLLAAGMRKNVEKLASTEGPDSPSLLKHAQAGQLLLGRLSDSTAEGCAWLLTMLEAWTERLEMPRLGALGVTDADAAAAAARAPLKNNPAALDPQDVMDILAERL